MRKGTWGIVFAFWNPVTSGGNRLSSLQITTENSKPTIVVAEEDLHVRASLCHLISHLPVEVISVSGGGELVRLLLTDVRVIDMLIVNADLPYMNGLCLASLTRRWRRKMRMILLTRLSIGGSNAVFVPTIDPDLINSDRRMSDNA